ncbi:hypothetical protein MWU57_15560 [Isoptericola sp. S6320L]|uniref:hypothetical protein n=1 Tax=Isoptericola sp. S6320L TaxID=2926411 RepID=UPI001FF223C6|nr:hypothetical protein [Isoptericola sp. S6320L]MCK0118450.1 hypothetical protein [Isoptericola sp. S6320L]
MATLLFVAAASLVCACSVPGQDEIAPQPVDDGGSVAFATTAADVIESDDGGFPLNLLFVAPPDDAIWESTEWVELAGRPEVDIDHLEIHRGTAGEFEGLGQRQLGNLSMTIPVDSETSFSEVVMGIDGDRRSFDVGDVRIRPYRQGAFEAIGDATLTAPECGTFTQHFKTSGESNPTQAVADNESTGIGITGAVTLEGEELRADVEVECSGADVYIFTPLLEVGTASERKPLVMDTVSVGTQPTGETIYNIAARAG